MKSREVKTSLLQPFLVPNPPVRRDPEELLGHALGILDYPDSSLREATVTITVLEHPNGHQYLELKGPRLSPRNLSKVQEIFWKELKFGISYIENNNK